MAGEAVAWAWMRSEASEGLNVGKTPEAYFKTDSVMTLIPNADGTVAAVKYDVRETDKLAQFEHSSGCCWSCLVRKERFEQHVADTRCNKW